MSTNLFAPPAPRSASELLRVEHTRMRRKVIYDLHEDLVRDRLHLALGTTRATATRVVDMTANPARYVCSQLAGLYREIPEIAPPEGGEDTAAAVLEAGFWQLAQRVQRDTIGMNDSFVRVNIHPGTKDVSFKLVPPDLVEIIASPLNPSQPLAMKEWIEDPDDPSKWVRLVCDPRIRVYKAEDEDGNDVTKRVLEGDSFSGDAYPFLVDDVPVLPYIAYHAQETGYALDPFTGRDIYEGAIQLGMYYSFFGHSLRQASWAQRYAVGLRPVGGDVDESGRRKDMIADVATVAMFEPTDEGGGSPQVGQWAAPIDPDRLYSAIERYERRLVEAALSTVGVSRRESDVRSAMSLAVSREAQRDAQRAYEPVFRRSDTKLLRLVAGFRGEPTDGWRINYRSLPRDASELAAELALMQGQIASGLLDKVSAYKQIHPGLTDSEAEAAVKRIAETNARLSGMPTGSTV